LEGSNLSGAAQRWHYLAINKEHILNEIRRTAQANGGAALGCRRFKDETGIGYYDWYGRYWTRWTDAVREAGLEPNRMNEAYDKGFLVEKLVQLTRALGRVPVPGDLLIATRNDPTFPSKNVFERLGPKAQRASQVIAFCEANPGNDDVVTLWRAAVQAERPAAEEVNSAAPSIGYVYLLKHGSRREYKIGRTNNPLRREGEVGIQLPEKLQPVHYIKTDDPAGIEAYWHARFASKRKGGEWFALTPADVRAFKRWKRID